MHIKTTELQNADAAPEDVAEQFGVSRRAVAKWEAGFSLR